MLAAFILSAWMAIAGPSAAANAENALRPIDCTGALEQGGLVVCKARPGARVLLSDGRGATVDETGTVTFGLSRKAPAALTAEVFDGETSEAVALDIAKRADQYRVIEGFDCDKVEARTPEQQRHAEVSWVKTNKAWQEFGEVKADPLVWIAPAVGPRSSPFGATRKYIGVSKETGEPCESDEKVHTGYDIAVPTGTEVVAPAAGTVLLADPDLYYQGGAVFIDHGNGLVSVVMHMSQVDVATGDVVEAGEHLGLSGATGRVTGPHVHWAVKWRDRDADSRDGDFYIDPELLLDLSAD